MLGKNMSRRFIDYLSSTKDDMPQWEALKNKLYVKGRSPIANYVYFFYVSKCGVKPTPVGPVCLTLVRLHISLLRIRHFHVESLAAFLTL